MPLRLPEPGTYEDRLRLVRIDVSRLIRLSISPATEPFWSRHARYRFDAPSALPADQRFGVCYAGSTLRVACAESLLNGTAVFRDGHWLLARSDFDRRWYATFQGGPRKILRLADLTGEALKALGLNNDLSGGDDYTISQQWAAAVHLADESWDGIRYVSRQHNRGFGYAIFNRSGMERGAARMLEDDERDDLCATFRIRLI